ncbi:MAG: O-antigen ligase family protein [Sulfuricella sp.]
MRLVQPSYVRNMLHVAAISSLFVGLLAGRFSVERLFHGVSQSDWLQFRLWGIALSAIFVISLMLTTGTEKRKLSSETIIYLVALTLLHIALISGALLLGNPQAQSGYLFDVMVVLVGVALAVSLFRSPVELRIFALIAETVGLIFFALAVMGFGNPELNGPGWAPFGGPITFYRIEFLTFCSGLYLFATAKSRTSALFHLAISVIGLFSAFMSLSKAPLVGAIVVVAYFAFWLFSKKEYARLGAVCAVTIIAAASLYVYGGAILQLRLQESGYFSSPKFNTQTQTLYLSDVTLADLVGAPRAPAPSTTSLSDVTLADLVGAKKIYLSDIRFENLSEPQQERIAALGLVMGRSAPDYHTDSPAFIRYADQMVVLRDQSNRLHLLAHAYDLFRTNKWFGVGVGNYQYSGINAYTGQFEEYKYPHNILMEVLATNGLVGLLLFALTLLIGASLMQRLLFRHDAALFFIGYAGFVFVTSLFSGDIYDFRLFWFVTMILIMCYSASPIESNKANNDVASR